MNLIPKTDIRHVKQ